VFVAVIANTHSCSLSEISMFQVTAVVLHCLKKRKIRTRVDAACIHSKLAIPTRHCHELDIDIKFASQPNELLRAIFPDFASGSNRGPARWSDVHIGLQQIEEL